MTLSEAIDFFLTHLRTERGSSPNTLLAYRRDLNKLLDHLKATSESELPVTSLSKPVLQNFLVKLAAKGLKPASQARCVACLKSFGSFLAVKG